MFGSVVPETRPETTTCTGRKRGRKDTHRSAGRQPQHEISTAGGSVYTPRPFRSFELPKHVAGPPVVEISLWHQCLRRLEAELPEQAFNTWIRPLQAVEDGGRLRLLAPNRYVVGWVIPNRVSRIGEVADEPVPPPGPRVVVEIGSRRPLPAPAPVLDGVGIPVQTRPAARPGHGTAPSGSDST